MTTTPTTPMASDAEIAKIDNAIHANLITVYGVGADAPLIMRRILNRLAAFEARCAEVEKMLGDAHSELGDLRTGTYTCHKCKNEQSNG